MKIVKFVLRIIGYLFVSMMVGYCLFVMNAKFVLHEQLPMLGGYGNAIVLSGSMSPAIEVNDLLIIQKCEENIDGTIYYNYEVGDIVTYVDSDNVLVTHRMIGRDGETIYTQGDANNVADQPFNVSRIKGKVIKIIPGVGKIVEIIQNPIVVVLVVVAAGFLMHLSYNKETEKKDEKLDALRAEIEALKEKQAEETQKAEDAQQPDDVQKAEETPPESPPDDLEPPKNDDTPTDKPEEDPSEEEKQPE